MPTTSPDSISYPDTSYTGGFVAAIAALATSVQTALSKRGRKSYQWADATARAAQAGMSTGDTGYQVDTAIAYRYSGSAWKAWDSDWITYIPTITNLAVGTGGSASSVWAYKFVGGDVKVKFSLVLGTSGASVSGVPTITVPVARAALAHAYEGTTGFLILYDTANTRPYQGAILAENTDATKVRLVPTNSGALTTAIAAGVPFTWGAGSAISGEFSYKAA